MVESNKTAGVSQFGCEGTLEIYNSLGGNSYIFPLRIQLSNTPPQ